MFISNARYFILNIILNNKSHKIIKKKERGFQLIKY
jgi:hypothetical protein